MSTTAEQILKQVEFYFSDSNLPKDNFLKSEIAQNEGWCRLVTLTLFPRLKRLSEDIAVIAEAVRKSTDLEVSEDGTKVRRVAPFDPNVNFDDVTVYIKGFPKDLTLDRVVAVLEEAGVKPICTRLRTYRAIDGSNAFKGSVFAQLDSVDAVKALVARTDFIAPSGEPFLVMTLADHAESERKEDAEKEAKRVARQEARQAKEAEQQKHLQRFAPTPFEAGHLIGVSNVPEKVNRGSWKDLSDKLGFSLTWCDFDMGNTSGTLKFAEGDINAICASLTENAKEISAENPPVFVVLTGDAETQAWDVIEVLKEDKLKVAASGNNGRDGKRNFRGGRGGRGGRFGGNNKRQRR